MSLRLYDRLQIQGGAVIGSDNVTRGYEEVTRMKDEPVVVLDNVTRYFYEVARRDEWRKGIDLPPFFPPFERAFFETRAPRQILDSKGRPVHGGDQDPPSGPPPGVSATRWAAGIGDGIPERWGFYLWCRDLERELEEEWEKRAAAECRSHLVREGFPRTIAYRSTTSPVRWLLTASFYAEGALWTRELSPSRANGERIPGPDRPFGPLVRLVLGIGADGQLVHYAGSNDRMRMGRPLFPVSPLAVRPFARILTNNAVGLFNPVILGMALMNCENVGVQREGPSPAKAKKVLKSKGRRPTGYYVLDIQPMRELLATRGQVNKSGMKRAFHLCRGYVRTYTPEGGGPFGRQITEPVSQFVSPHTRGGKSAGEVKKGYRVKQPHTRPAFKSMADARPNTIRRAVARPSWASVSGEKQDGENRGSAKEEDYPLEEKALHEEPASPRSLMGRLLDVFKTRWKGSPDE